MQPQQNLIKREDYKNVKHMDRVKMTAYLQNIFRRGYEAGFKAAVTPKTPPFPVAVRTDETGDVPAPPGLANVEPPAPVGGE